MSADHPIDVDYWQPLTIAQFETGKVFRTTHVHDAEKARSLAQSLDLPGPEAGRAALMTFRPVYDALGGRFPQGSVHVGYATRNHAEVAPGMTLEVEVVCTPPEPPRNGYRKVRFDVSYRDGGTLVAEQAITVLCTLDGEVQAS